MNTAEATVKVMNDTPVITSVTSSSPNCGGTHEGDQVTASTTFIDASFHDMHTVMIYWGDGNMISRTVGSSNESVTEAGSFGPAFLILKVSIFVSNRL